MDEADVTGQLLPPVRVQQAPQQPCLPVRRKCWSHDSHAAILFLAGRQEKQQISISSCLQTG